MTTTVPTDSAELDAFIDRINELHGMILSYVLETYRDEVMTMARELFPNASEPMRALVGTAEFLIAMRAGAPYRLLDEFLGATEEELTEDDIALIRSWTTYRSTVGRIDAVDRRRMTFYSMVDEQEYPVLVATEQVAELSEWVGRLATVRLRPARDGWVAWHGVELRHELTEPLAFGESVELAFAQPDFFCENPALAAPTAELQRKLHDAFVEEQGKAWMTGERLAIDVAIHDAFSAVLGDEADPSRRDAIAIARDMLLAVAPQEGAYGLVGSPDEGLVFVSDLALFIDALEGTDVSKLPAGRLSRLFEIPDVPAWAIRTVGDAFPDRNSEVVRDVTGREEFTWETDIDDYLASFRDEESVRTILALTPRQVEGWRVFQRRKELAEKAKVATLSPEETKARRRARKKRRKKK